MPSNIHFASFKGKYNKDNEKKARGKFVYLHALTHFNFWQSNNFLRCKYCKASSFPLLTNKMSKAFDLHSKILFVLN